MSAPAGNNTRPTTDRVRESLFSTIYSIFGDLENMIVLDAFAGSGVFALECVSRGAKEAVLIDSNKASITCIEKNVKSLDLDRETVRIINSDAFSIIDKYDLPLIDLVFFDPPYAYDLVKIIDLSCRLIENNIVNNGCLFIYEISSKNEAECIKLILGSRLNIVKVKNYSNTSMIFFTRR